MAPRRPYHSSQRRRALRSLQPRQRNPWLDRPAPARTQTHPRNPYPHRPPLPLHRTATPGTYGIGRGLNPTFIPRNPPSAS
ncbi:hypothetical protein QMG72_16080 [Pseudarthrobacter sp. PH31-O2]|nr:hypothetical protein [Pseudarthrobacter sp. PH31-O2]MDJ0354216.1 hypothetical protein [Pseudarthrobacter sp. PH31-O2]